MEEFKGNLKLLEQDESCVGNTAESAIQKWIKKYRNIEGIYFLKQDKIITIWILQNGDYYQYDLRTTVRPFLKEDHNTWNGFYYYAYLDRRATQSRGQFQRVDGFFDNHFKELKELNYEF